MMLRQPGQRHYLTVNFAAVLTFMALAALVLNAMLGSMAALVFMVC
ncbi:MAG: hypothetical protein JWQ65_1213, partial [Devosia sp.]|nr:hypothetical protein [Devosia sp.]